MQDVTTRDRASGALRWPGPPEPAHRRSNPSPYDHDGLAPAEHPAQAAFVEGEQHIFL